jgi:hypothetical protein
MIVKASTTVVVLTPLCGPKSRCMQMNPERVHLGSSVVNYRHEAK